MPVKVRTDKQILRATLRIIKEAGSIGEVRNDYSGRGMFGRISAVAVVTGVHPSSLAGDKLRRQGLSYDSMGKDWIYYTNLRTVTIDMG